MPELIIVVVVVWSYINPSGGANHHPSRKNLQHHVGFLLEVLLAVRSVRLSVSQSVCEALLIGSVDFSLSMRD